MQRAIMDGKSVTGITTMYMDVGLDTGDMLLKEEVAIEKNDNFESIHDKLGACGASLIVRTLRSLESGEAIRTKQNEALATYAQKITKEDCLIDFTADASHVHDLIRGLSPIPLAFTHTADGKLLKITEARTVEADTSCRRAGEVLSLEGGITVACGRGAILLTGVLPEGKSRMSAVDFIRGRKITVGDLLQ